MQRETRLNFIVLALILAVTLPGGVILFRKKSQPGERPIGSPDPVRQSTAYMDPYPAESYLRLAPLRTLQWVAGLANDNVTGDVTRITRPPATPPVADSPQQDHVRLSVGEVVFYGQIPCGSTEAQVMSTHHRVQLVSRGQSPSPWIRAIIWEEDIKPTTLAATIDDTPTQIIATARFGLPIEIRHELQEAGFVLPPNNITLVTLAAPPDAKRITLKWPNREETVELP